MNIEREMKLNTFMFVEYLPTTALHGQKDVQKTLGGGWQCIQEHPRIRELHYYFRCKSRFISTNAFSLFRVLYRYQWSRENGVDPQSPWGSVFGVPQIRDSAASACKRVSKHWGVASAGGFADDVISPLGPTIIDAISSEISEFLDFLCQVFPENTAAWFLSPKLHLWISPKNI